MKKELIAQLHRSSKEAARQRDGIEYWTARDLQGQPKFSFAVIPSAARDLAFPGLREEIPRYARDDMFKHHLADQ